MDAATVGVFRDVLLLVWLALVLGAVAYNWVRMVRPAVCWNLAGRVEARCYRPVDAVVVAAVMVFLGGSLRETAAAASEAAAAVPTAPPELTAGPMVLGLLVNLSVCAGLLLYLRVARRLNPAELFGLRPARPVWVVLLALLLAPFIIFSVALLGQVINAWMSDFWPDLGAQDSVQGFMNSKDPVAKMMLVVMAVIAAPLVEEIVFRGFIYGVVKRFTDGFFAAVCSALLFGLVHLHVGSFIPLTLLAMILCLVYEVTGSLLAPMVIHGVFNATTLVVMIFMGGGGGR